MFGLSRGRRGVRALVSGALTVALSVAVAAPALAAPALAADAPPRDRGGPSVTLDVISDSQGDLADLRHALDDLDRLGRADGGLGRAGALVVNGDLVPTGSAPEYDAFTGVLEQSPLPPRQLFAIGNHEYYTGEPDEVLTQRFLDYTDMPAPYGRYQVRGVSTIFLGSLAAPRDGALSRLGDEQLDWFDRELDRLANRPGPVLVFSHHPLMDTVSGTRGEAGARNYCCEYPRAEHDRLLEIMGDHPDVVFFTGHTHYDLRRDDWAVRRVVPGGHPEGFTAVNNGAIQTRWSTDATGREVADPTTEHNQGLRVRVEGGRTTIEAHDFRTDEVVNRREIITG